MLPDMIGVNYYVTSERYLDENIENYPPESIGGNGIQHMQMWKRYGYILTNHMVCEYFYKKLGAV